MLGNKKYIIAIFIAIVALVVYIVLSKKGNSQSAQVVLIETPTGTIAQKEGDKIMDQLKIEDITVGTGAEAVSGKKVTVNYLGTLTNGKKFDSSYDRGTPFTFSLGAGQVIKGWDMGVAGMKVGGKRRLTIPANLGYGDRGAGSDIPPGATLVFEVELLKVE